MIGALLTSAALAAELPACAELAEAERRPALDEPLVGTAQWTARLAFGAWRWFISPANGSSCAFYPTCSGYGAQAIRRHGPLLGAVMALERVNRNHDGWRYTPCLVGDRTYLYDPLSDNDFWLRDRR